MFNLKIFHEFEHMLSHVIKNCEINLISIKFLKYNKLKLRRELFFECRIWFIIPFKMKTIIGIPYLYLHKRTQSCFRYPKKLGLGDICTDIWYQCGIGYIEYRFFNRYRKKKKHNHNNHNKCIVQSQIVFVSKN